MIATGDEYTSAHHENEWPFSAADWLGSRQPAAPTTATFPLPSKVAHALYVSHKASRIWFLNFCVAAALCLLCFLVFKLPGDAAMLPGIPMILLALAFPATIVYGLYCSFQSVRNRPSGNAPQEKKLLQRGPTHTL